MTDEEIKAEERKRKNRESTKRYRERHKNEPKKEVCNMDCFNCIYPDCIKS